MHNCTQSNDCVNNDSTGVVPFGALGSGAEQCQSCGRAVPIDTTVKQMDSSANYQSLVKTHSVSHH